MSDSSSDGDRLIPHSASLPMSSLTISSLTISGARGEKQSRINGEYFELPSNSPGLAPVYRQRGGDYWLYYVAPMKQWHIGTRHSASDRIPSGFVHSRSAIPGACPSEARGWSGNRTQQPSLVVARVVPAELRESEHVTRDRRSMSAPPDEERRARTWQDSADRSWGDDSYRFGDITRSAFCTPWRDSADRSWGDNSYVFGDIARSAAVKFRERLRSSRRAREEAIREMESVQRTADAQRHADELEQSLCESMGDNSGLHGTFGAMG